MNTKHDAHSDDASRARCCRPVALPPWTEDLQINREDYEAECEKHREVAQDVARRMSLMREGLNKAPRRQWRLEPIPENTIRYSLLDARAEKLEFDTLVISSSAGIVLQSDPRCVRADSPEIKLHVLPTLRLYGTYHFAADAGMGPPVTVFFDPLMWVDAAALCLGRPDEVGGKVVAVYGRPDAQ